MAASLPQRPPLIRHFQSVSGCTSTLLVSAGSLLMVLLDTYWFQREVSYMCDSSTSQTLCIRSSGPCPFLSSAVYHWKHLCLGFLDECVTSLEILSHWSFCLAPCCVSPVCWKEVKPLVLSLLNKLLFTTMLIHLKHMVQLTTQSIFTLHATLTHTAHVSLCTGCTELSPTHLETFIHRWTHWLATWGSVFRFNMVGSQTTDLQTSRQLPPPLSCSCPEPPQNDVLSQIKGVHYICVTKVCNDESPHKLFGFVSRITCNLHTENKWLLHLLIAVCRNSWQHILYITYLDFSRLYILYLNFIKGHFWPNKSCFLFLWLTLLSVFGHASMFKSLKQKIKEYKYSFCIYAYKAVCSCETKQKAETHTNKPTPRLQRFVLSWVSSRHKSVTKHCLCVLSSLVTGLKTMVWIRNRVITHEWRKPTEIIENYCLVNELDNTTFFPKKFILE